VAYTTPPVFVDTAVLSAAQLNILSSNLEHFYGLASTVNVPFVPPAWASEPWGFNIRHRARYLNVYISYSLPELPHPFTEYKLFFSYGGVLVKTTDLVLAAASPLYLTVDLDAFGPFTIGTWYSIEIDVEHSEWGADAVSIQRIFESDTAAA